MVDVDELFVLGMSFLQRQKARVDFGKGVISLPFSSSLRGAPPVEIQATTIPVNCALNKTTADRIEAYEMLANNDVFACSAKQARKWLKHGAEAWLATAKIEPQTTQAPKHEVLNCPHCGKHHVDQNRWSTVNHRRHWC